MNKGLTVFIWKQEPIVETDAESGDQKVTLD